MSQRKIPIVEDARTRRAMLRDMVALEGYDTVIASSGAEATELMQLRDVDAMLVDWELDDATGPELCLFFQLMSRRYERAFTVMTSNKGFAEWGEVLGDKVMAAALIDRILHHCHIVNMRGNSYRVRQHTELWRALHQDAEETTRSRRKTKEVGPA
jgi:DNA-binding NtrC family response regulator